METSQKLWYEWNIKLKWLNKVLLCIRQGFVYYLEQYSLICLHFYFSGYFCVFTPGDGADNTGNTFAEAYLGFRENASSCSETCKKKIQNNPSINGATFKETDRKCFCEIGMVQVIKTESTFQKKLYTCKFRSKSSKVVLNGLVWNMQMKIEIIYITDLSQNSYQWLSQSKFEKPCNKGLIAKTTITVTATLEHKLYLTCLFPMFKFWETLVYWCFYKYGKHTLPNKWSFPLNFFNKCEIRFTPNTKNMFIRQNLMLRYFNFEPSFKLRGDRARDLFESQIPVTTGGFAVECLAYEVVT